MGTLLVQHIEGVSDERALELINKNVHIQFFCGLPGFQVTPPFDSSSMKHWRSWLGDSGVAALSETLDQPHIHPIIRGKAGVVIILIDKTHHTASACFKSEDKLHLTTFKSKIYVNHALLPTSHHDL